MTEEGMTENVNEHTQGHLLGAADIRRIAADAGISPTKKFGQNFVIDPGTVRRIVREAGVTADDHVLEVGPGLGSLTLAILETGATMTAVEIDPPVAERLPKTIAEFMPDAVDRFRVVNRDALTVNPENLPDFKDDDSFTLVANLPYNVTTPLITAFLEAGCFESVTVMIQKEVAQRLCAAPGTGEYGAFSVLVQWYAEPKLLFDVPPHCFVPQPKVTSAVVRMDRRAAPPASVDDEKLFFRTVRAAFAQRRKTLSNALRSGFSELDRAAIESAMEETGLPPAVRGETLSIAQFAALSNALLRKFDK